MTFYGVRSLIDQFDVGFRFNRGVIRLKPVGPVMLPALREKDHRSEERP